MHARGMSVPLSVCASEDALPADALPAAAFFLAFPRGVCALLYPAVTGAERETLVGLLRVSAVGGALLAGAQPLSACLTGLGRPRVAALAFTAAAEEFLR